MTIPSLRNSHGHTCGWDQNVVLSHLVQTCSCALVLEQGGGSETCVLEPGQVEILLFAQGSRETLSFIDKAIMEDEENADAFSEASDSPDEGDLEDASADFPRGLEIEASPSRPQRCPIPSQLLDRNLKSCIEQASECYALGAWI